MYVICCTIVNPSNLCSNVARVFFHISVVYHNAVWRCKIKVNVSGRVLSWREEIESVEGEEHQTNFPNFSQPTENIDTQ